MDWMFVIGFVLVWWMIGVAGFLFWWTKEFSFNSDEIGIAILVGFIGPLAWVIGVFTHHGPSKPRVLIKKRGGE